MADLMHLGNVDVVIQDQPGSPTDDGNLAQLGGMSGLGVMMGGGGIDLADLAQELDQDEFDGPHMLNGKLMDCNLKMYL